MKKHSDLIGIGTVALLATSIVLISANKQEMTVQAHVEAPEVKKAVVVELPEPASEEPEAISLGEFRLTAYCSCERCCGKWALNRPVDEAGNQIVIGASGERLIEGVSIAVDKEVIPYGSTVVINGKEYIAHDCGGSIKKKRIDVYTSSHESALEFGVQYAEVFMKERGE